MTLSRIVVFAAVLLICLQAGPPPGLARSGPEAESARDPSGLCAGAVRQAESRKRLPRGLMTAIATVESGRWDAGRQAKVAWPWTVQAEGRGRYFASKAAAIREVEDLQARGVTNIDVGCMQVNLHYHGEHFADLAEAMDPAANAAYAADFLEALYREKRSWSRAVAYYHSRTGALNRPYKAKVYATWREQVRAGRPTARPAGDTARSRLHRPGQPRLWRLAQARKAQAARTPGQAASGNVRPLLNLKLKRPPPATPESGAPAQLRRLQAPRSALQAKGANPPRRYRHAANPLLAGRGRITYSSGGAPLRKLRRSLSPTSPAATPPPVPR